MTANIILGIIIGVLGTSCAWGFGQIRALDRRILKLEEKKKG